VGAGRLVRLVAAVSVVAPGVAACGVAAVPAPDGSPTSGPTTPAAADRYDRLVLRTGDRLSASGRAVAVPRRPVRFCAPVPEPAAGHAGGQEPVPAGCDQGVDVGGVNLSTLTRRRAKDGAVEGFATLDVVYRGHGLVSVVRQAPYRVLEQAADLPDRVPCPAPTGGWPVGTRDENLDLTPFEAYADAHPGDLWYPAALRPSRTQVVAYALTFTDPASVAATLGPAYPQRLCVVRSRFSQAEIDRAADDFTALMEPGPVFGVGAGGLGPDAQPVVDVELTAVTPEIAGLAERQAAGLVRLQPWLTPRNPAR
jgi:hypothetical protein